MIDLSGYKKKKQGRTLCGGCYFNDKEECPESDDCEIESIIYKKRFKLSNIWKCLNFAK